MHFYVETESVLGVYSSSGFMANYDNVILYQPSQNSLSGIYMNAFWLRMHACSSHQPEINQSR
jgi:hypothetical protein